VTTCTAVALNTPTTTNKGGKRNLLDPVKRIKLLLRVVRDLGAHAIGMQEVGLVTRAVFRLHRRWIYLPARPNTVTRIKRKGNALALRRSQFGVIERKAIRVPYTKAFRGALSQVRVLTADKDSGKRVLWIVPHAPRRDEPEAQRRVWAHVASACQAAARKGIAVVVLPDTNGLALAKEILGLANMRLAQSADVEAIFVSRNIKVVDAGVDPSVAGTATDHKGGLPWAKLRLDESVDISTSRIPV
jgi:hypothetical protein